MNITLMASALGFIVAMLLVGIYASSKVGSTEDFFVAGRKVPSLFVTMTLIASELGAGAMIAAIGLGYSSGWGNLWYIAPFALGSFAFAVLLAKPLKEDGDKYKLQSMFDWLAVRFDDYIPIRVVGALIMTAGLLGGLAGQCIAMGNAFYTIGGIPMQLGTVIGGGVLVLYSSLGGLYSVIWTDVLQGAILIFGLLVMLPIVIVNAGGFAAIRASTPPGYWTLFPKSVQWHLTMLVTMLCAPFVRQYYYQRMFASDSIQTATKGMKIQALALLLAGVWACIVGMAIFTINPNLSNPELAFTWTLKELFSPAISAIVLGALIAAIMSTGDTFLNACTLTLMRDIYQKVFPGVSDEKMLKYSRNATFLLGALAITIGMFATSVLGALTTAWKILGGGLMVPMFVTYYWKRATKQGTLCSLAVGLAVTLFLTFVKTPVPSIFGGLGASLIALVLGSLLTAPKEQKPSAAA